ncbi:DNA polymerase III subunit chi [Novosphingobium bradum]|uniref:DNA polymerase III subunit chi n=1 Tax=Novosphingobium bradum TaxID=1737444 RepID=A0ABV7IQT6_9SPHN
MQVDFYQVSRDPAEAIVAMLAEKTLAGGQRLLVVASGAERLEAIGQALWSRAGRGGEPTFIANGRAGAGHEERQPVLLAETVDPANGARFVALADGLWRDEAADPARFDRAFLVFDAATLEAARACWRSLGEREGLERNFWKQEGGRWTRAG